MEGEKLSRREFLCRTGAAAALAAAFPWSDPIATGGILHDSGLSFNCVAGDVTTTTALIWLRAEREETVSIRYGKDPDLKDFVATRAVKVTGDTDFAGKISLERLEPASVYFYQPVVQGKNPGPIGRLKTAPRPDAAADVRFAFSGDTRQIYRPFLIMDAIRAMKPDFFLHLGDTIYADMDGRAATLEQYWAKYRANRGDPPSQNLFSETSLYVAWDDHEVENNYHRASPLAAIGRKAFFDYWPVRQDPTDADRIYRSVRWGRAVEIFILDARQYRDRAANTLLGQRQKHWFLAALGSSDASFKFVATPVPFSSPHPDKWGGFPEERSEVLDVIKKKKVSGVVFLSADAHYAAVTRVPRDSGFKEFITGPLAAKPNEKMAGAAKRFEFFRGSVFNYGLVSVYGSAAPPYAELEILGKNNEPLYKTKIELS